MTDFLVFLVVNTGACRPRGKWVTGEKVKREKGIGGLRPRVKGEMKKSVSIRVDPRSGRGRRLWLKSRFLVCGSWSLVSGAARSAPIKSVIIRAIRGCTAPSGRGLKGEMGKGACGSWGKGEEESA